MKRNYEEDAKRLVSLLGYGKRGAVRRTELLEQFGGTDRQMRKTISYARLKGVCIINDQDGDGYYIARTLDELRRQYKQMTARALDILAQRKAVKATIRILEDIEQLKLDDIFAEVE